MSEEIRFGVLCNGTTFPAWQAECIDRLMALQGVNCCLLISPKAQSSRPKRKDERRDRRYVFRGLTSLFFGNQLWKKYSATLRSKLDALTPIDLASRLSAVPRLECTVYRHDRFSNAFADSDLRAIRGYRLDFIICFAFGIVRGGILDSAKHGLWSFHHGDEESYRGSPAGFWEIYDRQPVTGAILQRLTERLDGGVVLHKGFFKTSSRYVKSLNAVLWGCTDWPARVVSQLMSSSGDGLPTVPSETRAPIRRAPSNIQFAIYVLRWLRERAAKVLAGALFEYREVWNVGFVDRPIQSMLSSPLPEDVVWMPQVSNVRFAADPFGLPHQGRVAVLFEDYSYHTRRGVISAAEFSGGAWNLLGSVMDFTEHLSYPYLIRSNGEIYCIPESVTANETILMRAAEFPETWSRAATLRGESALIDPTVFEHEGRWWMLATQYQDCGQRIDDLKLFGWHAPAITGPWTPHKLNPLKTDVRGARPAGTPFLHEGQLYRPAQDSSETYGGRVRIYRVNRLSPDDFDEVEVRVVEPPGQWPHGIHTLSAAGNQTVIDAKREIYVIRNVREIFRGLRQ